ncbi:MAG: 4a-hydroxytetrahydrobiopterin dehydratase [Acidobacteriaceae bacterium]|nr:4a-hydroxytetrahydrobiopterin dehydratase [Acidobacteriaceae bacterium]
MRDRLESHKIQLTLNEHPSWQLENGTLTRWWKFPNFVDAMQFVNGIAALAEAKQHHPDIDIRYNWVKLTLTTHDSGGITAEDVEILSILDQQFGL